MNDLEQKKQGETMNITEDGEIVSMAVEQNVLAILNKSEIDQQITTAKKYPRSVVRFRNEALELVTLNERVAESCLYAVPRDGKTIEGPSARFAEIIYSAWSNSRAGARVVSDSGEFLTAQGVFHDLERNTSVTIETQRRITGKNGRRYSADMIVMTGNAACSIALRNAILKGIPKAFWDDLYEAARKTVMGDFKTLTNRREEALTKFLAFGVAREKVCATLGVAGVEDIGLEHLVVMRGLLTAIREGDTTPEQAFAAPDNGNGNGNGKGQAQAPQSKSEQALAEAKLQAGPQEGPHTLQPNNGAVSLGAEPTFQGNTDAVEPERKPAAQPKQNGDSPLASEGEKNYVLGKLKLLGLSLDQAFERCQLSNGPLTVDKFIVIKDYIAQSANHA